MGFAQACGEPEWRQGESKWVMPQPISDSPSLPAFGLRPWQRLSVRLACLLAAVTLCAVAAVGGFTYARHQRELEDTVGTQLLNIARVTALLVDPGLHAQVQRSLDPRSAAYQRIKRELVTIQNNVRLRLRYSAQGPESEDIYGKVVRADGEGAERLARIYLTSTTDADARRLEGLLR